MSCGGPIALIEVTSVTLILTIVNCFSWWKRKEQNELKKLAYKFVHFESHFTSVTI